MTKKDYLKKYPILKDINEKYYPKIFKYIEYLELDKQDQNLNNIPFSMDNIINDYIYILTKLDINKIELSTELQEELRVSYSLSPEYFQSLQLQFVSDKDMWEQLKNIIFIKLIETLNSEIIKGKTLVINKLMNRICLISESTLPSSLILVSNITIK